MSTGVVTSRTTGRQCRAPVSEVLARVAATLSLASAATTTGEPSAACAARTRISLAAYQGVVRAVAAWLAGRANCLTVGDRLKRPDSASRNPARAGDRHPCWSSRGGGHLDTHHWQVLRSMSFAIAATHRGPGFPWRNLAPGARRPDRGGCGSRLGRHGLETALGPTHLIEKDSTR